MDRDVGYTADELKGMERIRRRREHRRCRHPRSATSNVFFALWRSDRTRIQHEIRKHLAISTYPDFFSEIRTARTKFTDCRICLFRMSAALTSVAEVAREAGRGKGQDATHQVRADHRWAKRRRTHPRFDSSNDVER